MRSAGYPVVVVDDGSDDGTGAKARSAGAEVIHLPENRGKGTAIAAGLVRCATPYIILMDADLVGLQKGHIEALLTPVSSGQAEMSVGIFRKGRWNTDLAQKLSPNLSGQRALKTELLRQVPGLADARFDVEVVINTTAKEHGWRVVYVPMSGVSQVTKEQKRGFARGFVHRMQMYYQLLRGWIRLRRQRGF